MLLRSGYKKICLWIKSKENLLLNTGGKERKLFGFKVSTRTDKFGTVLSIV
jgi:hypothetical protein